MTQYLNVNAGYLEVDELDSEAHHAHEEYVITLMLRGYVTLKGNSNIQITPGTLTLVPSGFPHALLKGKAMSVHWLSFSIANEQQGELSTLFLPFRKIRQGALPIVQVDTTRLPYLITLFKEIERVSQTSNTDIVLSSLINLIMSEATATFNLNKTHLGQQTRVNKAMQFIERHCCEGISLKDVAQAVHLSPAHLTTKMKESTGFTVGQWIIKHRLKVATDRLQTTDDTIENIASHLGWTDVTHFIRQFRKAHHLTPGAWRRQYRKQQP